MMLRRAPREPLRFKNTARAHSALVGPVVRWPGGEPVSKANGFLQLRRGLWEHIRDGRMSITQALAFIYVCSEADTRTGIWKGSAKSLSGELGIPERTARDVLEKMEHADYIRRFAVPGRHSCYPILVHKFLITDGEHDGEQLNAIDSKSPVDLAYFPREQCVEHGAAQKRKRIEKENENEKKKHPEPLALGVSEEVFAFWDENRGPLPEVLKLTQGRKGKILSRMKSDPEFPETFKRAVLKARETPFCTGAGGRGWKANFDWFIANDTNCVAVLEGKYDGKPNGKGGTDADTRTRENLVAAGLLN